MSGRLLSETWGKLHFWTFFAGFNLTFFPQFLLGLSGMPRRIADYSGIDRWTPLNLLSTVGALLTGLSMLPFAWNVVVSLRRGEAAGDDPWEGNSLEWATTSPRPTTTSTACPDPLRATRVRPAPRPEPPRGGRPHRPADQAGARLTTAKIAASAETGLGIVFDREAVVRHPPRWTSRST